MIQAGSLDRRITLQRATETANELNEPILSWATLAEVWGSKTDVSDAERIRAQGVGASLTTRFVIRWSSDVSDLNPKDQLVCDGRTYGITAVKEIGRREGLEITASVKADA